MRLIASIVLLTLLLTLASANNVNLTQLLISTNGTITVRVPPIGWYHNNAGYYTTTYIFTAKNGKMDLLINNQSTNTINFYNNSPTGIYNGHVTRISSITNSITKDTNFTSGVVYTNKSSTIYYLTLYGNYTTTWINTTTENSSIKANESSMIHSLLSRFNIDYNISGVISSARNYLIQQYGQEYVDNHMNSFYYTEQQSSFYGWPIVVPNVSGVYFNYFMPAKNGSTVKISTLYPSYNETTNSTQLTILNSSSVGVFISNKNNSVVDFLGPDKPYVINITKQEAMSIAEHAGLQNVSAQYSVLSYAVYQNQFAPYSNDTIGIYKLPVVWAILSNNLSYVQLSGSSDKTLANKGLYIDPQNGSVLGEFSYHSHVPPDFSYYEPLGTYSLFSINGTNIHVVYQTPVSYYLLVVAIIIILAIIIYLKIKRK